MLKSQTLQEKESQPLSDGKGKGQKDGEKPRKAKSSAHSSISKETLKNLRKIMSEYASQKSSSEVSSGTSSEFNFSSLLEHIQAIVSMHLTDTFTKEELTLLATRFLKKDDKGKIQLVLQIKSDRRFVILSIFDEAKLVTIFEEVLQSHILP